MHLIFYKHICNNVLLTYAFCSFYFQELLKEFSMLLSNYTFYNYIVPFECLLGFHFYSYKSSLVIYLFLYLGIFS